MPCCCSSSESVNATDSFFSKQANRYLKKYRRKGLSKEQQMLVEGIKQHSLSGKSILEIGCGVGGLHLTLVKVGAANAVGIDISQGMIAGAKQLTHDLGLNGKTEYFQGDYVTLDEHIPKADITVMDKVVCCYQALDVLISLSLNKTKGVFALSFPKPAWYVKAFFSSPHKCGETPRMEISPLLAQLG